MNNNEILDNILMDVSSKIINNQNIKVSSKKENKFIKYNTNINFNIFLENLRSNIENITNSINKNLLIIDYESLSYFIKTYYLSENFKNYIAIELKKPIFSKFRVSDEHIINEIIQRLFTILKKEYFEEKVFSICKSENFTLWLKENINVIICAYFVLILHLSITYFVFITK